MDCYSFLSPVYALLRIVGFLLLELILTVLVYTGLNYYSLNLFGYLVGASQSVLDLIRLLIRMLLPAAANAANATLIGEFSAKSILLLLIGLVVAALVRTLVGLVTRR